MSIVIEHLPDFKVVGDPLPDEAGRILALDQFAGKLVAMCENGPYELNEFDKWVPLRS